MRFRSAAVASLAIALVPVAPAAARSASGQVFAPNPVADLGIQTLTDQKDADYFSSQYPRAYHRVTLTDLDSSGALNGRWVTVKSETGDGAKDTGCGYVYTRNDDRFEQTMGYFWVTQAQRYIQSLGFGRTMPAVNDRQIELRINQFGGDNSFFREDKANITLGKGGVDDAEDAEVIVHEYGHSVQDSQVPGFGTNLESGSIGEGFSDYLAVTVSSAVAPTADPACVADWDAVSYTRGPVHCLRRVDGNKVYPADLENEVHSDDEIWSRALWDIRKGLGPAAADQIIIRAQFGFAAGTSMRAAAAKTIATAALYGAKTEKAVRAAFAARGLA